MSQNYPHDTTPPSDEADRDSAICGEPAPGKPSEVVCDLAPHGPDVNHRASIVSEGRLQSVRIHAKRGPLSRPAGQMEAMVEAIQAFGLSTGEAAKALAAVPSSEYEKFKAIYQQQADAADPPLTPHVETRVNKRVYPPDPPTYVGKWRTKLG